MGIFSSQFRNGRCKNVGGGSKRTTWVVTHKDPQRMLFSLVPFFSPLSTSTSSAPISLFWVVMAYVKTGWFCCGRRLLLARPPVTHSKRHWPVFLPPT
jgi:hypothetical protein